MPDRTMRAGAAFFAAALANLALAASPPATEKQAVTDTFFGVAVTDPYRWLEDNTSATQEARALSRDIGHVLEAAEDLKNIR